MKQYAASPVINKLIADRDSYFANDWQDDFYNVIWNVDTAQGIGLDIWGRIVVIGRDVPLPATEFFGFHTTPTESWNPFNQESFYPGPVNSTTYTLTDPAYRVLILAKALTNISPSDSRSLNRALQQLFPGRGRAWVNDLGFMAMRFVFEFALEPWEQAVLVNGNVLPRPAGVDATLAQIPVDTFGFNEAGDCQPFNQGTFMNSGALTDVN